MRLARREDEERVWGGPIESFWADRLQFVPLLPPSSPAGVLETGAIGNRVLLPCHAPP